MTSSMTPDQVAAWRRLILARVDEAAKKEQVGGIEGLKDVVSSAPLVAALGVLQYDMNSLSAKILGMRLDSRETIYNATRLQGNAEGILYAITTLLELAALEIYTNE